MHLSASQIHRYRHARLAPAELLALDDHLAHCEFCRLQLRSGFQAQAALRELHANFQRLPEAEHVSPEQCAAFTQNRLDAIERELVSSHLEVCPGCTTRLQSLQASLAEPQSSLFAEWLAFLRDRLALLWPMPVAAAAAVILVTIVDHLYFRERAQPPVAPVLQQASPQPSVATPSPKPAASPSPSPKPLSRQR
jgi:anti-sigma factor RsiW